MQDLVMQVERLELASGQDSSLSVPKWQTPGLLGFGFVCVLL